MDNVSKKLVIREARTLSPKVTCNFPGCKSRKSMLENHVNDHFGLKRVFRGIVIVLFLFLNFCVLYSGYILPHVPSPSPFPLFLCFPVSLLLSVIYKHNFMHLYKI